MSGIIYRANGEASTTVAAQDRAFQYGDGLFETIRVRNRYPEFLYRHLTRLQQGCQRLKISAIDWNTIEAELVSLAKTREHAVLKVIISRGSGARGYRTERGQIANWFSSLHPLPAWPDEPAVNGIRTRVCSLRLSEQPALAGIKHLNRLEQVMARAEWDDEGVREGLMMDAHGHIIEGTMSNLFVIHGQQLKTAALSRCGVSGIYRSVIIDYARDNDILVIVNNLTQKDLEQADEVFMCNSVIGIWPVTEIDSIGRYSIGPLTKRLARAVSTLGEQKNANWHIA